MEISEVLMPHEPPEGYSYESDSPKRGLVRIWIVNHYQFSYTSEQVKSVWGFYKPKTKKYHAPINSTKVGDAVDPHDTTPYSAMQILKPLAPTVLSFV